MTVPVSVQQRIRVLDAHGMSWRSIAKEVGVARDTVAKYAGREDCSPGPERSVSRPSKLDPFRATVLLQCLFDRFGSVFPQCGLMVFPGVVIVSR